MEWQAWTVLFTLLAALSLLFLEKFAPDQVMLGALVLLWNLDIVPTNAALKGFGNEGLITVGALFIVVCGVEKSKLIGWLMRRVLGRKTGENMARARMCGACFVLSAVFNNTPIVSMLIPIIRDWARERGLAPSKFLIPLSYATIMGGLLTMIGTSTNLLINGLLSQSGYKKFDLLAPLTVALPVGAVGLAYLLLVGHRFLPENKGGLFREVREHGEDLVTAVELTEKSRFLGGKAFDIMKHLNLPPESLLKIRRSTKPMPSSFAFDLSPECKDKDVVGLDAEVADEGAAENTDEQQADGKKIEGQPSSLVFDNKATVNFPQDMGVVEIYPVRPNEIVETGDILLLSLPRDRLVDLTTQPHPGLRIFSMHALDALGPGSEFIELVLGLNSPLLGRDVKDGAHYVEQIYGAGLIAFRRRDGTSVEQQVEAGEASVNAASSEAASTPRSLEEGGPSRNGAEALALRLQMVPDTFHPGDVLLVLAPTSISLPNADFLLITRVAEMPSPTRAIDLVPALLFLIGLVLAAANIVPMSNVAVTLSIIYVLGGWVPSSEVSRVVDMRLLILIGASLGISEAMQKSGLASALAGVVLRSELPQWGMLSILFITTCLVTEVVTNNAAAALGVPLAISIAEEMKLVSPHPLVMVVLLAASTSYASPIGYQTNLMVMGPGGYSFRDFIKIGILMDLIWMVGVCSLTPLIWPLEVRA